MRKIIMILPLLLLTSCINYGLKISSSEYKNNVNKILIIPVYTDANLIPEEISTWGEYFQYNTKYIKEVHSIINKNKSMINNTVEEIFKNGKFKNQTIVYNDSIEGLIERRANSIVFNKKQWDYNYSYELKKDIIKDLCIKYSVNAIVFHYIQSIKLYSIAKSSNTLLPTDMLVYVTYIYDSNSKKIYENNSYLGKKWLQLRFITDLQTWSREGYGSKEKYILEPVKIEIIENSFSKKNIDYLFKNGLPVPVGSYYIFD